MRKISLIVASALLATFSAGATWYLMQSPAHRSTRPEKIVVGPEEPDQTVSPEMILVKPSPPDNEERDDYDGFGLLETSLASGDDLLSSSAAEAAAAMRRPPVITPDWQPGDSRLEESQPVTDRGGFVMPRWSPVGLDIAFTKADAATLWISGTTPGGRARLLADDPGVGDGFIWNLDGMSIHTRAADGRYVDVLITGEQYPASERTAKVFERDGRIWIRPDGDGEPVMLSGPEDRFFAPVLSPDETKVAWLGRETGLYMASSDGARTISVGPGEHPTWLPDSSGIVYHRAVRDNRGPVDGELWFASADGRERTNLTNSPGVVESHPHVAPDGQRIAYSKEGAIHVARFIRPPQQPQP